MANLITFEPDYIIAPGETINELLEHYNMTQKELASRIELSLKTVNEIVKGKASISYETATKLENVFSIEASFWNNLEKNYQEQLAEVERKKKLEMQIGELKKFPIKELQKRKWIPQDKETPENKVDTLLKYFGVSSFEAMYSLITDTKILEGAYRITPELSINEYALICWIRKGEIEASEIITLPFDKRSAMSKLSEIRKLTTETDPKVFIPKLQEICSSFGVAIVFVPELKGSRVSGLTRWLTPKPKAIIQLSVRYKTNDSLWFTLFHELGHVLLHEKKPFVEFSKYREDKTEHEADAFAANILIPPKDYKAFLSRPISRKSILDFSNEIGIHPGIIVGRLQNEKKIPWSYMNDLKVRYQWTDD
ncbi:HigA family addiction module antitoxin [Psychrobacillus sp. FSL K6-1464]|uniref:HigA family addiction module antitoxin n=1 Tax=Psychrobacillus sp. FSL K6-1464 TaxID=2921545 RepID=UPI0030F645F7